MSGSVRIKVLVLEVEKELMAGCRLEFPATIEFERFVELVCSKYPRFKGQLCPDGKLAPYIKVLLNGRALTGTGTEVAPGSEVVFFPAIHGG